MVSAPNKALPVLTTDRLTLSRLTREDAPALFAYRSDPNVARYQSSAPSSVEDSLAFIDSAANEPNLGGTWFQFGVRLNEPGNLIGDVGIHFLADEPRQVEVGVTVAPQHQGRGVATEALAAALGYLFDTLGKHRVTGVRGPAQHGLRRFNGADWHAQGGTFSPESVVQGSMG